MLIGCPKEIKDHEKRVALTPAGAAEFIARGHDVVVEESAGLGSGFADDAYVAVGARIVDAATAWSADLVLKVKEPQPPEFALMRPGQVLFTYLHLAAAPSVAQALKDNRVTAIAYENVTAEHGLPLLAPMSEVAGKLATQVAAYHLMHQEGGKGLLMGGVTGTAPAKVVVVGGGVAGENAAEAALGLGAETHVFDISVPRLRELVARFGPRVRTHLSTQVELAEELRDADVVIGTVLIPGDAAPKLVTHEMVEDMREGSVLVDVAIDQGGCFEDSHPTTHTDPTFEVSGCTFYCVANMPGSVPNTATVALTNATLPYALRLADGWRDALAADEHLAHGLNTHDGRIVHPVIAGHLGEEPMPLDEALRG
ncbi:alanine dehydrogenase [Corynebacterium uterequi]|uniref:Alanine dehydrogenase n=1 Tax=Corynebacterium uterequi TaxID=1072256 RepID=A0A0G3HM36_9CORY|nr:alanine dehydrogenase [Corynebacterium uterequi]AKK12162.1 alanine dehydrogenase [Corynebacterium uterequi]